MHKSVQSEILRLGVPSIVPTGPDCVDKIGWLNVAGGLLPEAKTQELMKHAAQCGHCGPLLKHAAETLSDEMTPSEETLLASLSSASPEWQQNITATLRRSVREQSQNIPWWRGVFVWLSPAYAFAGIAVVAIAAWIGLGMLHPPSAEQLLAQAYTEHRTLQLRIAGAKFSPMQVERGEGTLNLDRSPALLKAEALISKNLRERPNDPAWLHAKARADLLEGNYESAIKSLELLLKTQPESTNLLCDLATAYFERAVSASSATDFNKAMDFLERALEKSPNNQIALFNRAVISERMLLYDQAVNDWNRYLRIDPTGPWADDARVHLVTLQEKLKTRSSSHDGLLVDPRRSRRALDSSGVTSTRSGDYFPDETSTAS